MKVLFVYVLVWWPGTNWRWLLSKEHENKKKKEKRNFSRGGVGGGFWEELTKVILDYSWYLAVGAIVTAGTRAEAAVTFAAEKAARSFTVSHLC